MQPISSTKSGKSLRIYTPDGYKTFQIQGLERSLQKIYAQAAELTEKFHSTPKFPEFLGGDTRTPIFIRKDVEIIQNVLNKYGNYSPETVYTAARRIKDIGRNKADFNREFYGEVAAYYGYPKFTVKQTRKALKEKKFKTPAQDVDLPRQSQERYERIVEWLYNEYDNISYKKIVNLSQAQLMEIVENAEIYGNVPSKYTSSYHRKGTGYQTFDRNKEGGAKISDPLFKPIKRK